MSIPQEFYVSVDVETSGPVPGQYSLLSIGACTVYKPRSKFYAELKPVNDHFTEEAMAIHGLSLEQLAKHGEEPAQALARLESWLAETAPPGQKPVFVAFNAGFDWMFVAYYFQTFLGRNPFGYAPLDIKAYYMGKFGVSWAETSKRSIEPRFLGDQPLRHHAQHDALDQADIFLKLLEDTHGKR